MKLHILLLVLLALALCHSALAAPDKSDKMDNGKNSEKKLSKKDILNSISGSTQTILPTDTLLEKLKGASSGVKSTLGSVLDLAGNVLSLDLSILDLDIAKPGKPKPMDADYAKIPDLATYGQNVKTVSKDEDNSFKIFGILFNRKYVSAQAGQVRQKVFTENLRRIKACNSDPNSLSTCIVNKFADMTPQEVKTKYAGLDISAIPIISTILSPLQKNSRRLQIINPPAAVDWRTKGKVSPVKDQLDCGCCYAFSAVGAIESAYAIKNNLSEPVLFSEQQLIDCSTSNGNRGCQGGLYTYSFNYAKNAGLQLNSTYPYMNDYNVCSKAGPSSVNVSGYVSVPARNYNALKAAVAIQPVSIGIQSTSNIFLFYSTGIIAFNLGLVHLNTNQ